MNRLIAAILVAGLCTSCITGNWATANKPIDMQQIFPNGLPTERFRMVPLSEEAITLVENALRGEVRYAFCGDVCQRAIFATPSLGQSPEYLLIPDEIDLVRYYQDNSSYAVVTITSGGRVAGVLESVRGGACQPHFDFGPILTDGQLARMPK